MKAVTKMKLGYHHVELREVPEPTVRDDLVKIKVAYTGICGSDIHTYKGEYNNAVTPVILGHEFSGLVVEVGPEVVNIKVGDRVTSETTFATCGTCRYCLSYDYNLCDHRQGIGTQVDGSMTDFVLSREESCHVLPENVSYQEGALSEPLSCCVHAALEKSIVKENHTVLVIGPGPIGLLLAQVAKSQGATVILSGVTSDQKRLLLAKKIGIDYTIDSLTGDLPKLVTTLTNGYGVDRVFDCSGSIVAVNQALSLISKTGTFVQVGLFASKANLMEQETIIQREIAYVGSRSQKPSSWELSMQLLSRGELKLSEIISKIYPVSKWQEAFEAVISGEEVKVLLESNLDWQKV